MPVQQQEVISAPNSQVIVPVVSAIWMCQVSVANTNRDGTGNLQTLGTGAPNGTRLSLFRACASGTTTNGMVRLYLRNPQGIVRLWDEMPITAATPSATVETSKAEIIPTDESLLIPYKWSMLVSTHNAETFNVFAFGGNL